jgi:hypothetical protein
VEASRLDRLGTILIDIAPEKIALFKAIVESYDNLATLRTEDPQQHLLKLYFAEPCRGDVEELLDSLAPDFQLQRRNQ